MPTHAGSILAVLVALSASAARAECGDGKLERAAELCDDGNVVTGDGCNANCEIEAGYACQSSPSVCCFPDVANAYALRGDAVVDATTGEVTLTPDVRDRVGVAWFRQVLDFTNPFAVTQRVYLGHNDDRPTSNATDSGGDGMSLMFQRDPRGLAAEGAAEGDLGALGIVPVLGVELDTYNNGPDFADVTKGDEDHTAIFHTRVTNSLVGATCFNDGDVCKNVEDGRYHAFKVVWTGNVDRHLQVWFEGLLRIDYVADIVGSEFGGDPTGVYFGFGASTGSSHNLQKICPGAPDGYRVPRDFDKDGIDDAVDPDDDNDTLDDATETSEVFGAVDPGDDADRDGVPNYRDTDYWRDVLDMAAACPDVIAPIGSCDSYPPSIDPNGDGVPAHLDAQPDVAGSTTPIPDRDGDGVPDSLDVAPDDPCSPHVDALGCPELSDAHKKDHGCSVQQGGEQAVPLAWLTALGALMVSRLRRRSRA